VNAVIARPVIRFGIAVVLLAVQARASFATETAPADETKEACVDAHERGQRLDLAGKLRAARETFMSCAQEACPLLVRRECTELAEGVAQRQPSVLVTVLADGAETLDARLSLDGDEVVLSGRPLDVDPGAHVLRAALPDGRAAQQRLTIRAGEQQRVTLTVPPRPPAREPRVGPPVAAFVSSGVAALGVGSFVVFGIAGRSLESDRAHGCAHACTETDLAPVRRDYLIADISLSVGVVAAGIATWLFLRH